MSADRTFWTARRKAPQKSRSSILEVTERAVVCVCVLASVCVYMGGSAVCVCASQGQHEVSSSVPSGKSHLSPPPKHWDWRCALPHPAFYLVPGDPNPAPDAYEVGICPASSLPFTCLPSFLCVYVARVKVATVSSQTPGIQRAGRRREEGGGGELQSKGPWPSSYNTPQGKVLYGTHFLAD